MTQRKGEIKNDGDRSKQHSISSDSSSNIIAKLEHQTLDNTCMTLLTGQVDNPAKLNNLINVTQNKARRKKMGTELHQTKSSKWEYSINGGRLRSHVDLWKEQNTLYQNWSIFNKTVPNTIWTNGASIRNSATTTPSEKTGKNHGQKPRTATHFLI